jgi:threonine aldolase
MELKRMFVEKGIPLYIDSPTNQQFPILTKEQMKRLEGKVRFEVWQPLENGSSVTRFATSWATLPENIKTLESYFM